MSDTDYGSEDMSADSKVLWLLGQMKGQLDSIENRFTLTDEKIASQGRRIDRVDEANERRQDATGKRQADFDRRLAAVERRQAWIAGASAILGSGLMLIAREIVSKLGGAS